MLYSMSFVAGILIDMYLISPVCLLNLKFSQLTLKAKHLQAIQNTATSRARSVYWVNAGTLLHLHLCIGRCFYAKQIHCIHGVHLPVMHSLGIKPMTLAVASAMLCCLSNRDDQLWCTSMENRLWNPSISQATDDWSVSHWWWCAQVFISLLVREIIFKGSRLVEVARCLVEDKLDNHYQNCVLSYTIGQKWKEVSSAHHSCIYY